VGTTNVPELVNVWLPDDTSVPFAPDTVPAAVRLPDPSSRTLRATGTVFPGTYSDAEV
jgi:hypothetical protein